MIPNSKLRSAVDEDMENSEEKEPGGFRDKHPCRKSEYHITTPTQQLNPKIAY